MPDASKPAFPAFPAPSHPAGELFGLSAAHGSGLILGAARRSSTQGTCGCFAPAGWWNWRGAAACWRAGRSFRTRPSCHPQSSDSSSKPAAIVSAFSGVTAPPPPPGLPGARPFAPDAAARRTPKWRDAFSPQGWGVGICPTRLPTLALLSKLDRAGSLRRPSPSALPSRSLMQRVPLPSATLIPPRTPPVNPAADYFGPGGVDRVLPIVCISYVWDTEEHPDPTGEQVRSCPSPLGISPLGIDALRLPSPEHARNASTSRTMPPHTYSHT
eukprot:scaffold2123_cov111-Isochrysis_galbana.AAC.2